MNATHIGFADVMDAWAAAERIAYKRATVVRYDPYTETFYVGANRFYVIPQETANRLS